MTEREMRRFLRAEDWRFRTSLFAPTMKRRWFDPKDGESFEAITDAYRVAKRRKDARDRARLKKAGWVHRTRPYECWSRRVSDGHWETSTKAGSLATLED